MKVDLLLAKTQRAPRRAAIGRLEDLKLHAQQIAVEGNGGLGISRRHDDMVDGCDHGSGYSPPVFNTPL